MYNKLIAIIFISCFLFMACENSTEKVSGEAEVSTEVAMKYKLTPFTSSPEYPDAAIESMEYSGSKFNFGIGGDSYKLGTQTSDAETKMCANSAKGQHIHLIVDNGPYAAKYTSEFTHEIADGEHYLLAFLSRSYHESIKTDEAHVAQKVTTSGNSITSGMDIEDAMLFYSRPKGTYVGKDTEKVMLDFYLANTSLASDGNKVKAEINGEEHILDTWQPYYVEGMEMGENTIKLSLIDNEGKLVDAPLNPVTTKFSLKADPTPAN